MRWNCMLLSVEVDPLKIQWPFEYNTQHFPSFLCAIEKGQKIYIGRTPGCK